MNPKFLMKTTTQTLAALALLTCLAHSQTLINDAMEGYPTATATSVVSNAANSNPASWQTVVFSASGAVTTTAGIGTANGKTGKAAVMNTNFSTAGNQWAGAILNSAAYNTPATLGTSLSNFQFTVDLRGSQAAAVTVAFLSYSASAQLTGSMEKTFTLTAANTYQTFSGDLGQNGWAPDSSKLAGASLVLNAPRYGWSVVVHAEGNGGWGFDSGNVLDIDNVNFTASQAGNNYLPVTYDGNGFFTLNSGQSSYIGYKPDTYSHANPISLFVWMHGCGGNAAGDMWTIAPYATRQNQSYIAISIGGRDGACWQVNNDTSKVLAAIDDVARYFNINPRKVYLGGYSSGGDLTYRVGFENASRFAGLLVENSDPFVGTGRTGTHLMAAASWKINVAHLAHLSDTTYPIATVRANMVNLTNNAFPATLIEKAGGHYDADNGAFGTNYDLRTFLLPYLDAGWSSPSPGTADIAVKRPDGTALADGGTYDFGPVVRGTPATVNLAIANSGSSNLTGLTLTKDGTDAAAFNVTVNPTAPVIPAAETTFTVQLNTTNPGQKTAALHIASNDPDEHPYDINLTARVLSFSTDTDGDGMSDAAEFTWRALNFDWQVSQSALVTSFLTTASNTGLYTAAQVQALHVGTPLIARNPATGQVKLTIGVKKSIDLDHYVALPLTSGTTAVNGTGDLEFTFTPPDSATFFRLESR
jgi:predicted esterase